MYFLLYSCLGLAIKVKILTSLQTDVESDTEEDEYESEGESAELLMEDTTHHTSSRRSRELTRHSKGEEEDEMFDPHSAKFRAEGQLMSYEDDPSFEGYLTVRVCV